MGIGPFPVSPASHIYPLWRAVLGQGEQLRGRVRAQAGHHAVAHCRQRNDGRDVCEDEARPAKQTNERGAQKYEERNETHQQHGSQVAPRHLAAANSGAAGAYGCPRSIMNARESVSPSRTADGHHGCSPSSKRCTRLMGNLGKVRTRLKCSLRTGRSDCGVCDGGSPGSNVESFDESRRMQYSHQ